jgi:SAM-dependent methyltransferase
MSVVETLLERTFVYRAWQAPFAGQKFIPVIAHNALDRVRRVLDVACGPGTNTRLFKTADYLGIDFNERYIEDARRRHHRNFLVADARTYVAGPEAKDKFDFVLVNSFLHHLNTKDVREILAHLSTLLTDDGHIHMLELVLPEKPSIARLLARWDRGKFARPLVEWESLFGEYFEPVVFEPYTLTGMGATLWNMVYFKGKRRS